MANVSNGKRDFFLSFAGADRRWAQWLAHFLRENGYTFWFQDQDFHGSIPLRIGEAHAKSQRTIVILSEAYTKSGHCRSEWAMRYHEDPGGEKDLLILFRVSPCTLDPVLAPLSYIDLFACDEAAARKFVLDRIRQATEGGFIMSLGETSFPSDHLINAPFPVPKHNLPPPNLDFVGREDVLTSIRELLAKDVIGTITRLYAITGLGGVGKTQTALAYCYRHLAEYQLIWWLRAAEPAMLAADFITLVGPLSLPEEHDQARAIQAVKAKLQATPGWLLIFDSAENPTIVRPYLPGTGGGHVLLTSRHTDWQGTAAQGMLEFMSEPDAIQLLTRHPVFGPPAAVELAEVEALARKLGYLPLALVQAKAYMVQTGESFEGYCALMATSGTELLKEGGVYPDYPEPVVRTWDISIHAAEQQCPAARPLLELLAFLAPAALPHKALDVVSEALPEGLQTKLGRNSAIRALHRFSLIRTDTGSITIHCLVQAVTRDRLDVQTARARTKAAVDLVNAALPDQPKDPTNWPAVGALLPHALAVATATEQLGTGLEAAVSVLNRIAMYHHARAAFAHAAPLFQRALSIAEDVLGPKHPDTASSLNNLAGLYRDQGKLSEAEPLFRRALDIAEEVRDPKHPDIARNLNDLASLNRAQGKLSEAEPLFRRALNIAEEVLGSKHPDTACSLNNLAGLYRAQGKLSEAEPLFRRALDIAEEVLGSRHPDTARSFNNLAILYRAQNRLQEAAPLLQRALAIAEDVLGPKHPFTATVLNNLAELHRTRGKLNKAEPLFRRALSIAEEVPGPEHPFAATVLNNLAELYRAHGKLSKAEPLFRRALQIREKVLGSEHPDTNAVRETLAALQQRPM